MLEQIKGLVTYYIACYCTTAVVQVSVVWLTTHYKHLESIVLTPMNAEDTSRKRDDRSSSSLESLCGRSKMKANSLKRCRCSDRARVRRSENTKDSERYLFKRNRLVTSSILRLCALLECANRALMALLETS